MHIFPINGDKENAVISRLFSMFSINLVQAKSSKNKGFYVNLFYRIYNGRRRHEILPMKF